MIPAHFPEGICMWRHRFSVKSAMGILALILSSPQALAHFTTLETGQMLKDNEYRLSGEVQFLNGENSGANFAGRFDWALDEEFGWKTIAGFGTTDFFAGGFLKWVPIPDTDTQPAIGIYGGPVYAHYDSDSEISFQAHPFIAKLFHTKVGDVTPYGALPISIRTKGSTTDIPVQLALGTELRPDGLEKISFMGEIGFNLAHSFSYFVLAAVLSFDQNGIEIK
jgi:hypothetical protein